MPGHLVDAACGLHTDVTWSTLPIAEHALGWLQGQGPAADWLAQRFAGQPTAANCQQP